MGRLGDADWWWDHGLDGLVGGLIAGLVTVAAVWLAVRLEHRGAQKIAVEAAVADMQARAYQHGAVYAAVGSAKAEELFRGLIALHSATFHVTGRASRRWPGFTKSLMESLNRIQREVNKGPRVGVGETDEHAQAVGRACSELSGKAGRWLMDSGTFEPGRWRFRERERLREALVWRE